MRPHRPHTSSVRPHTISFDKLICVGLKYSRFSVFNQTGLAAAEDGMEWLCRVCDDVMMLANSHYRLYKKRTDGDAMYRNSLVNN
jgi:hypothetical protein